MKPKSEPNKSDLTTLEVEYNALRSVAESFCGELKNQIATLLEREGIALGFPIQHRVKMWPSLSEKLERLSFQAKGVREIRDFVGLRLILLFRRDIEKVCHQIQNNFTVIRRYNTQERVKDDQFGYSLLCETFSIGAEIGSLNKRYPLSLFEKRENSLTSTLSDYQ